MATIKEIAQALDISIMTVSRAFNNPKVVKESLREQIYAKAQELGYVPNQTAKSLASKKTGIIQIITRLDPKDPYFTRLFTGAAEYLSKNGYSIMISHSSTLNVQCDGAIFMGLLPGEDKSILSAFDKPKVLFGKSDTPVDWVDIDNEGGIQMVTEMLIEEGHTNIGFVGIKTNEGYGQERYDGFISAMQKYDLPIHQKNVYATQLDMDHIRAVAGDVIKNKDISAVVCSTDLIGFGLIDVARNAGIYVPRELSVVGFDGLFHHLLSDPKLTTVAQPVYKIGQVLAKTLLERMEEPNKDYEHKVIPLELLREASVVRMA